MGLEQQTPCIRCRDGAASFSQTNFSRLHFSKCNFPAMAFFRPRKSRMHFSQTQLGPEIKPCETLCIANWAGNLKLQNSEIKNQNRLANDQQGAEG